MEPIAVLARAPRKTTPADVFAAFRSLGDARPLEATRFRFEWSPVLASMAGERDATAPAVVDSIVTPSSQGWRWELDPSPLTTGRVLWRTANALRFLTLLSVMVEKNVVASWYALYQGTLLAAHERPGGDHTMVVTEGFAELVAGKFGRAAFLAVPRERFLSGIDGEDEATLASERTSTLIAAFVEDQLAVRPPISQAEVDELKRRLGVTGQ